jgi:hypothetical protein
MPTLAFTATVNTVDQPTAHHGAPDDILPPAGCDRRRQMSDHVDPDPESIRSSTPDRTAGKGDPGWVCGYLTCRSVRE